MGPVEILSLLAQLLNHVLLCFQLVLLLAEHTVEGLDRLLGRLGEFTVLTIEGFSGASLLLLKCHHVDLIVSSFLLRLSLPDELVVA